MARKAKIRSSERIRSEERRAGARMYQRIRTGVELFDSPESEFPPIRETQVRKAIKIAKDADSSYKSAGTCPVMLNQLGRLSYFAGSAIEGGRALQLMRRDQAAVPGTGMARALSDGIDEFFDTCTTVLPLKQL